MDDDPDHGAHGESTPSMTGGRVFDRRRAARVLGLAACRPWQPFRAKL